MQSDRSRDWRCPSCGVLNHELLPDKRGKVSSTMNGEVGSSQAVAPEQVETPLSPQEASTSQIDSPESIIPARSPIIHDIPAEPPQPPVLLTDTSSASHLPPARSVVDPSTHPRSLPWLASRRSHESPIWIDLCLAFLIAVLAILILKRIA